MLIKYFFCLAVVLFPVIEFCEAQHSKPDTLEALRISTKINFDGNPDEAVWQTAQHITNFTQRELHFGEPASEKTETAILYDNNSLYIGVWCYQKNAEKIAAKYMSRDFDYESDDIFGVLISPFMMEETDTCLSLIPMQQEPICR